MRGKFEILPKNECTYKSNFDNTNCLPKIKFIYVFNNKYGAFSLSKIQ